MPIEDIPDTLAEAIERPSANPDLSRPSVPGYRIVRRLGQGGMAVVYLAVQESLDREVAIKVMAPSASADEAQAQRFEHEARIIAKLEHPGIVGIHEVGRTQEGQLYYVMPYLARGDLSQRDYHNSETRIVDLLRGLLDALGYAHARGIVHRDVKAENVLFNNADQPQLTDFGIALSRRSGRARITTDGLALGSGGYMSPEQARGEQVDGRADLYSLGVLTYELLTGELPFQADDPLALALMHAQDPVPPLPPEKAHWQAFVSSAMAKSPDRRFRNAQAMTRALDAVARRLEPPSGMRAFVSHAFWRRPPGLIAAGMLVALALGAVWLPRLRDAMVDDPVAALPDLDAPIEIPPEAVAPTAAERQAAIAQRLSDARAQLDAGAWVSPAGANAAESYLAVLRAAPGDEDALMGLDAVLVAVGDAAAGAIARGARDEARERWEQARLLAESARLQERAAWPQVQATVRTAASKRIEAELASFDREAALAWSTLPAELGIEDAALAALRERAGQLPETGAALRDDGGPALVYLGAQLGRSRVAAPFAMMRQEITRAEYGSFVAQTKRAPSNCRNRLSPLQLLAKRQWNDPGFDQAGNHPAVCISFDDARAYAAWLSRRTGQRYRLPTLDEWRHAAQYVPDGSLCRAGNIADQSTGGLGERHACNDTQRNTAPVGSYAANRVGLRDLIGNAGEWTLACDDALNVPARTLDTRSCAKRIAAGTSWRDGPSAPAASHRQILDPSRGYDDVGFRLVREL
jgi:serine/threonine-protein kinase PpkA